MDTILKVVLVGFSLSMASLGAANAQVAPTAVPFGYYWGSGPAAYPTHEGRTVAIEPSRHYSSGQVRHHSRTGELR